MNFLPLDKNDNNYTEEIDQFFAKCYTPSIADASLTARRTIRFFSAITFIKRSLLEKWIDSFYLSGNTRFLAWVLMVFGWLLVGILSASFVGVLRRED